MELAHRPCAGDVRVKAPRDWTTMEKRSSLNFLGAFTRTRADLLCQLEAEKMTSGKRLLEQRHCGLRGPCEKKKTAATQQR